MRQFFGVIALALVAATPAFAQKTGMANTNAPTITQSIALGKDTIELTYTSITWAQGQWAAALEDQGRREKARAGINANAEKVPLGSFKTGADLMIGTTKVAAGTYKLAFVLDEQYKWQIQLTGDAGKVMIPLDLKPSEQERKRLTVGLCAGEKDFTAELYVAFGKNSCLIPVTMAKSS